MAKIDNTGLPASVTLERIVLGSMLQYPGDHPAAFQFLTPAEFSLEKHRRIFLAMKHLDEIGRAVDRITVAEELTARKQLESVDGLAYLIDLDVGLPQLPSIESYIAGLKEKSALRKIIHTARNIIARCLEPGDDSQAIIASGERALEGIESVVVPVEAEMQTVGEIINASGGINAYLDRSHAIGVATPWPTLTDLTGGFRRGELFLVAGNPSSGKSALALQVAASCAEQGHGTLIFSLEMTRKSLIDRLAASRGRVDGSRLRVGRLDHREAKDCMAGLGRAATWPLRIAEHGVSTVLGIRSAIRRQRQSQDVFLVVIDYLQLMQGFNRASNRNEQISELTRGLKLLAVDENVCLVLLSQLSRENVRERRAPALSDLRDSGSIEQDADAVLFAFRPEMLPGKRHTPELRGVAEFLLEKQRDGPLGRINMRWISQYTIFEQLDGENETRSY